MMVADPPMGVLVSTARIVGKSIPVSEKITDSTPVFSTGIHAYYKRLSPNWGMKFYRTKERSEANYRVLSKAAAHGLAPRCGGKFSFKQMDIIYHGFIVERIQPAIECKDHLYLDHPEYRKEVNELDKALREIDICGDYQNDLHSGNVGYTKEGKLVAIDLSCSTDDY